MEKINKNRKSLVSTTLLIVLLIGAFALGGGLVYVFAPDNNTGYLEEGSYPGATTYTVWRLASTYYAKDAHGHIPTWGISSNASQIIQACIDNAEAYDSIYLRDDLTITNSIVIDDIDHLRIFFDSLYIATNNHAIHMRNHSRWIHIEGESLTFSGLYANDTSVIFMNDTSYSEIDITTIASASANHGIGIELFSSDNSAPTYCNEIFVNTLVGCLTGVLMHNSGSGWVSANYIRITQLYSSVAYTGIMMNSTDTVDRNVNGNTIYNTVFEASGQAGDIGFWNDGNDNMLLNCKALDLVNSLSFWNNGTKFRLIGFGGDILSIVDMGTQTHMVSTNGAGTNFHFSLVRTAHPDTFNWNVNHTGAMWYCVTHSQMEYWNGTHEFSLNSTLIP